jgi:hypothetical protein
MWYIQYPDSRRSCFKKIKKRKLCLMLENNIYSIATSRGVKCFHQKCIRADIFTSLNVSHRIGHRRDINVNATPEKMKSNRKKKN